MSSECAPRHKIRRTEFREACHIAGGRIGVSAYYEKEMTEMFRSDVHFFSITIVDTSPFNQYSMLRKLNTYYELTASRHGICSAIKRPISREAVAAGEGALHTCIPEA